MKVMWILSLIPALFLAGSPLQMTYITAGYSFRYPVSSHISYYNRDIFTIFEELFSGLNGFKKWRHPLSSKWGHPFSIRMLSMKNECPHLFGHPFNRHCEEAVVCLLADEASGLAARQAIPKNRLLRPSLCSGLAMTGKVAACTAAKKHFHFDYVQTLKKGDTHFFSIKSRVKMGVPFFTQNIFTKQYSAEKLSGKINGSKNIINDYPQIYFTEKRNGDTHFQVECYP